MQNCWYDPNTHELCSNHDNSLMTQWFIQKWADSSSFAISISTAFSSEWLSDDTALKTHTSHEIWIITRDDSGYWLGLHIKNILVLQYTFIIIIILIKYIKTLSLLLLYLLLLLLIIIIILLILLLLIIIDMY